MLRIDENTIYSKNRIENLLNKHIRGYFTVDKAKLSMDIDKVHDCFLSEKDRHKKKRYKECLDYLTEFEDSIKSDYIPAIWKIVDGRIEQHPFKFRCMKDTGIDSLDYVIKRDDKTVSIRYKQLWDLIALQIAHRDLDFETKEIDKMLTESGHSLSSVHSPSKLFELTVEEPYKEAIELMIGDTQYTDMNKTRGRHYIDYFGKYINTKYYRDIINSSIQTSMLLIVLNSLEGIRRGCSVEFLGIVGDRVYFNTDMSNMELRNCLMDRVVVRAFGRYFEIESELESH